MFSAVSGKEGMSIRNNRVAASAPANWAATNGTTSSGRMPAKVLDSERAMVTAGLANEVEEVNQYAAVMYAPTAKGTLLARSREHPHMTESSPKVATNSLNTCAPPVRTCCEKEKMGRPNIR